MVELYFLAPMRQSYQELRGQGLLLSLRGQPQGSKKKSFRFWYLKMGLLSNS